MSAETETSVLIVGAGIAGLLAAGALQRQGRPVLVIEKARGVGGRLASRRLSDSSGQEHSFDHGCPDFQVQDPSLTGLWSSLQEQRVAQPARQGRLRGLPTMTAIPKRLAQDLPVRLGVKATAVSRSGSNWRVSVDPEHTFLCQTLVLTCPIPQALALLAAGSVELPPSPKESLSTVRIDSEAILMSVGSQNYLHRFDQDTTLQLLELSEEAALTRALELAEAASDSGPADQPESARLHRWRYSQVQNPLRANYLEPLSGLFLAGDAFAAEAETGPAPREGVERAAVSGLAAARAILAL